MSRRTRVLAVAVLGTVAVAGACSSSPPAATDTTKAPVTATTPVTISDAQRAEVLAAGVLTAADLGDGWAESLAAANRAIDADTFSFMLAEPSCAKVLDAITKNEAVEKNVSPRFGHSTAPQTAENSVTVMKSQANAEKLILAINKDSSQDCLDTAFENGMKKVFEAEDGVTVTSVRVKKLTGLTIGALRAGFEVTVDSRKGDGPIQTVIVTRVSTQEAAAIIDFTFGAEGFAFPDPAKVMAGPLGRVEAILDTAPSTSAPG